MIQLETQIQLLFVALMFGFAFSGMYSIFNYIFYHKPKLIRLIFEIPLFIIATLIYFYFNYKIGEGILNIYYILFMLIGVILYQRFYAASFLKLCSKIEKFLKRTILLKIYVKTQKYRAIIKTKFKRKRKKDEKIRITGPNAMEQKPGDIDVAAWNFPAAANLHD